MAKITDKTVLGDVLNKPGASKVLAKYRVPCLGCPMAAYEMGKLKLGDIAKTYGIDMKGLLTELNQEKRAKK
jgi:hypothetical protein